MASAAIFSKKKTHLSLETWFLVLAFIAGLLVRIRLAWMTFLNPDEALHYFLSRQPSLKQAYEASLTTAHPPLMIIFLHYWSGFGSSEFYLRMPFVLAGTLFCWVMFLWVEKVANRTGAWFAFALFLFTPSLISLSAEIRQYSFLLLFCGCCLFFLEEALGKNSAACMAFSAVALYLALVTHYSALIFAAAVGIYAVIRLFDSKLPVALWAVWLAAQAGVLAICIFLFESQISPLRKSGVPSEIASTWLRSSIFHRGEDHLLTFVWTHSVRLFRYFFSHGAIGVLGLVLFLFAIAALRWSATRNATTRSPRALVSFLLLPFVITLCAAIAGIYPYGGTRHDSVLILFALSGIAIGLDRMPLYRMASSQWLKPVLLVSALAICNLFSSPSGPYIRPANQRRQLMQQAVESLRSLPSDSTIFTDAQGSMVLNYYLCGEAMPLPFGPGSNSMVKFQCGNDQVLTSADTQAGFDRATLSASLQRAWSAVPGQSGLYLFQSGWIDNNEDEWLSELRTLGGVPRTFGPNILICLFVELR